MLTLTPAADAAIAELFDNAEAPEEAGLRLSAGEPTAAGPSVALNLVEAPLEEDAHVPTSSGHDVYVAPEAADLLAEHELDAAKTGEGVAFSLRPRITGDGRPD